MKKIFPLFLISLICSFGQSQSFKDTVVVVSNFDEFYHTTCSYREGIIQAVLKADSSKIRQISKLEVHHIENGRLFNISKLLTASEMHLIYFLMGEHEKLITDLKNDEDYHVNLKISGSSIFPNFDCGNLIYDLISFWVQQDDNITNRIQMDYLDATDKEILSFYWQSVFLAIQEKNKEFNALNERAKHLKKVYPYSDSGYDKFLKRMSKVKRSNYTSGYISTISLGTSKLTGPIESYLIPNSALSGSFGYQYNKLDISFIANLSSFNNGENQIKKIDDKNIINSSRMSINSGGLRINYEIFQYKFFRLKPYIGIDFVQLTNFYDVNDSTTTSQRSKHHPAMSLGLDFDIRIWGNKSRKGVVNDFRERYNSDGSTRSYSHNIRLTAGYIPSIFYNSTSINGSYMYFGIGYSLNFSRNSTKYNFKGTLKRNFRFYF